MNKKRLITLILAVVLACGIFTLQYGWLRAGAEESYCTCYVMCKPGDYVNVRRTPSTDGQIVGYLDAGDWFETDGTSSNGFIRVYGIGEYGEGWVYCGYVVTQEPKEVMQRYVCVAKNRVACRRWMNGPKVSGSPWLTNLSTVTVFYEADGWSCTSRGYIRSEYLEADQT